MDSIRIRDFVDGAWVDDPAAETLPLYNPSTGQEIGRVTRTRPETSRAAIDAAARAYDGWRSLSVSRRIRYLFDLRRTMEDHQEDLAQAIALDQAKHVGEARGEVARVIEIIETACGIPTLIQGETLDNLGPGLSARVIRQPLGVFAGVAPFNFPALVFGWFVPFAIGAGNTFIFKPSPLSPYFMQKMADLFLEIGLPAGVVNVINGEADAAQPWFEDPRVRGICMVGSSATAKKIAAAAGMAGKRTMLLGGAKNYLVAMDDLPWDVFLQNFIHSCYGSAGQRCLAGSIVAASEAIYDELIERVTAVSKSLKVGSALDPSVHVGPVISAQARDRVNEFIRIGVEKDNARLVLDGRNPDVAPDLKGGYYVGPTIFANVTPCMTIIQEEIFGPVVGVMKIDGLDHALDLIRRQPYGNGACIFTQNLHYAEEFIRLADVGMIGVNVGVPAPHPYLPFGGIKDSLVGTNKVQGKDGIDFFTQNKIATIRAVPPRGPLDSSAPSASPAPPSGRVRSCVAG